MTRTAEPITPTQSRVPLSAAAGGWLFAGAFVFDLLDSFVSPPDPGAVDGPIPGSIEAFVLVLAILGIAVARGVPWVSVPVALIGLGFGGAQLGDVVDGLQLSGSAVWTVPLVGFALVASGLLCVWATILQVVHLARDILEH